MISPLRKLLTMANVGIAKAEEQAARQKERIHKLKKLGRPTMEEEKTLDVIEVIAFAMQDNRLMIERLLSSSTWH